ncbi:hypothetical protein ACR6C2_32755 [Streptomyces sp. INA 01156]
MATATVPRATAAETRAVRCAPASRPSSSGAARRAARVPLAPAGREAVVGETAPRASLAEAVAREDSRLGGGDGAVGTGREAAGWSFPWCARKAVPEWSPCAKPSCAKLA